MHISGCMLHSRWVRPGKRSTTGEARTAPPTGKTSCAASSLGPERRVGIEGPWGYGRGLAQYPVELGVEVYEINARWTAIGRRGARRPDKTVRLDTRAVALFLYREARDLHRIAAEDETAVLNLLTLERESAIAEAHGFAIRCTLYCCSSTPSTEAPCRR